MALDGSGSGGGKKQRATLMQLRDSITAINARAMRENAFHFTHGFKVDVASIGVVDMLIHSQAMDRGHPNATDLNDRVRLANEVSEPTARDQIKRAVDLGIISEEREGVYVKYFFSVEQAQRIRQVLNFTRIIPEVVKLQEADVFNENAGSHLLPPGIYYNVIRNYKKKED